MIEALGVDDPTSLEDERFDLIYPPRIRQLSTVFWTPVRIAAEAANWLVRAPGIRVLDIGCGAGKFCLVGASLMEGCFTGIEQRVELVAAARQAATVLELTGTEFIHGNILEVPFASYDAFYLFNPFEENLFQAHKLDSAIRLSPSLFRSYTNYVSRELAARPMGTRVVSYAGYGDEIPACYSCESALFGDDLKFWVKTREDDPEIERLGLHPSRSYRGSAGWQPPRT